MNNSASEKMKAHWQDPEFRAKMSKALKKAGHKHTWHTREKIDPDLFMEAYDLWCHGKFKYPKRYAEYVGFKRGQTIQRWINKLYETGELDGTHFTDGKPIYAYIYEPKVYPFIRPKIGRKKRSRKVQEKAEPRGFHAEYIAK